MGVTQARDKKRRFIWITSVSKNGIDEVIKRDETKNVLKEDRLAKETKIIDKLFKEIKKAGLAVYGFEETKKASELGAIEELLISDHLIKESRENSFYSKIEAVLRMVESSKGKIFIISSVHEAGQRLDGLGGIAALLRYNLNYQ